MFSLRSLCMRHYLIRDILTNICFTECFMGYTQSKITKVSLFGMKSQKGTSWKTVWRPGHYRGVERWVSSEWWWRWCHADACPHRCIGKVTSTSTVKMAHWWPGEGYAVYKGEKLPCTKDRSTTLTSLLLWYSIIWTKASIRFPQYKDRKSGKNSMTMDLYLNMSLYNWIWLTNITSCSVRDNSLF